MVETGSRMAKTRLDALLVERGLYPSRRRAAAAVLAGRVRIGEAGGRGGKPGMLVAPDVPITVEPDREYVSRGGIKLANALDAFGLEVAGRRCLDVGASTGGFSDCLLQRGAAAVIAVDVGYGQLAWSLREDPRVTVLERTNARALDPAQVPFAADLVVVDVSFISLAKVLPAAIACVEERFDCLALVKPQFELGPARVGKGGVVRAEADRREAIAQVARAARGYGWSVLGFAASGLPGPAGNRETFIWIAEGDRAEAIDVDAALAEIEP